MISSCARPSGLELIWRVSHIIITPMRSQASTHSGVGMLCEVRTALQPMSRSTARRKALQAVGQRRAHAGVVLVIAGALDLDRFAVEEEALVRIEDSRAHAKGDALGVARLAVRLDGDDGGVEVGLIDRPERGIRELGGGGVSGRAVGGDGLRGRFGGGDRRPLGIEDLPADFGAAACLPSLCTTVRARA